MASPARLRNQAEAEAVLRYAPQQASLHASLAQAIADRNAAIRAAATAYTGASGAIHRAGPQVRRNFREAARSTAGTDAITRKALGGLAPSPGVDVVKAAAAHEGAAGGRVLARRLAERLADLSDRRIAAAAGRAYVVGRANADYSAAAATNAAKRSDIAAQQGLFAQTRFGALEHEEEGRQLQRDLQRQRLHSQAQLQSDRLVSQASLQAQRLDASEREGIRDRKNARRLASIKAKSNRQRYGVGSLTQEQETKHIDAIEQIASIVKSAPALPVEKNGRVVGQRRATPKELRQKLLSGDSPIGRPIPADLVDVAMDLASKGWISRRGVEALHRRGLHVPKAWAPTVVGPHLRRRPR